MKKNIILFSIVFIAAMVTGPIFAGAGTLYGVKHPTASSSVQIYEIDLSANPITTTLIATGTGTAVATSSYNGAAYDKVNDRFYFTLFDNSDKLFMIPDFSISGGQSVPAEDVGSLTKGLSNGTFYNGNFYYITHLTDILNKVGFSANGYIYDAQVIGNIAESLRSFYFGDIAFGQDGTLYGSASTGGSNASPYYFFKYDQDGNYTEFANVTGQTEALQIAFADDGELYGHGVGSNNWYKIDKTNGSLTLIGTTTLKFSDLANNHTLILEVGVDIKPGSYPNSFNLNGNGVIPVAILGSETFDALEINPDTLIFAGLKVRVRGKKGPLCNLEDVSGDFSESLEGAPDGYLDLVCQFEDDPDAWVVGESGAEVTGQLYDGTEFTGSDTIRIVPE